MRGFVKWGSIILLVALVIMVSWGGVMWPGSRSNNNIGQQVRYGQPGPNPMDGRSMGTVMETRKIAESVPGVKRAWPIQSGNDMLVGIEIGLDTKGRGVPIEEEVAQRVRTQVPMVDKVRVTSKALQVSRIRSISQSIGMGRTTGDYARPIADLWRSIPDR